MFEHDNKLSYIPIVSNLLFIDSKNIKTCSELMENTKNVILSKYVRILFYNLTDEICSGWMVCIIAYTLTKRSGYLKRLAQNIYKNSIFIIQNSEVIEYWKDIYYSKYSFD